MRHQWNPFPLMVILPSLILLVLSTTLGLPSGTDKSATEPSSGTDAEVGLTSINQPVPVTDGNGDLTLDSAHLMELSFIEISNATDTSSFDEDEPEQQPTVEAEEDQEENSQPEDEEPVDQEEENSIQELLNSPDVEFDNTTDTIIVNGTRISIVDEEEIIPEMFVEYEEEQNEISKDGEGGAMDNVLPGQVDVDAIKNTLQGEGAERKARGVIFGEDASSNPGWEDIFLVESYRFSRSPVSYEAYYFDESNESQEFDEEGYAIIDRPRGVRGAAMPQNTYSGPAPNQKYGATSTMKTTTASGGYTKAGAATTTKVVKTVVVKTEKKVVGDKASASSSSYNTQYKTEYGSNKYGEKKDADKYTTSAYSATKVVKPPAVAYPSTYKKVDEKYPPVKAAQYPVPAKKENAYKAEKYTTSSYSENAEASYSDNKYAKKQETYTKDSSTKYAAPAVKYPAVPAPAVKYPVPAPAVKYPTAPAPAVSYPAAPAPYSSTTYPVEKYTTCNSYNLPCVAKCSKEYPKCALLRGRGYSCEGSYKNNPNCKLAAVCVNKEPYCKDCKDGVCIIDLVDRSLDCYGTTCKAKTICLKNYAPKGYKAIQYSGYVAKYSQYKSKGYKTCAGYQTSEKPLTCSNPKEYCGLMKTHSDCDSYGKCELYPTCVEGAAKCNYKDCDPKTNNCIIDGLNWQCDSAKYECTAKTMCVKKDYGPGGSTYLAAYSEGGSGYQSQTYSTDDKYSGSDYHPKKLDNSYSSSSYSGSESYKGGSQYGASTYGEETTVTETTYTTTSTDIYGASTSGSDKYQKEDAKYTIKDSKVKYPKDNAKYPAGKPDKYPATPDKYPKDTPKYPADKQKYPASKPGPASYPAAPAPKPGKYPEPKKYGDKSGKYENKKADGTYGSEYSTTTTTTTETYETADSTNSYNNKGPAYSKLVKCSVKYVKSTQPVYCNKGDYCVAALPLYKTCYGSSPDACPMEARCASSSDYNLCASYKCPNKGEFCILAEKAACSYANLKPYTAAKTCKLVTKCVKVQQGYGKDYPKDDKYPKEDKPKDNKYPKEQYPKDNKYPKEQYPKDNKYPKEQYPKDNKYPKEQYPKDNKYPKEQYPKGTYPKDTPKEQYPKDTYPKGKPKEQYPKDPYTKDVPKDNDDTYGSEYSTITETTTYETKTDSTDSYNSGSAYSSKTVKCTPKYVKSTQAVYCNKGDVCVAVLPVYKTCSGYSLDACPLEARCASSADSKLCSGSYKCPNKGEVCVLAEKAACSYANLAPYAAAKTCQLVTKCVKVQQGYGKDYPTPPADKYPKDDKPKVTYPPSKPADKYPKEDYPKDTYPADNSGYTGSDSYKDGSSYSETSTYTTEQTSYDNTYVKKDDDYEQHYMPTQYKPEKVERLSRFYKVCKPHGTSEQGLCLVGEKCIRVLDNKDPCLKDGYIKCSMYKPACQIGDKSPCSYVPCQYSTCKLISSDECTEYCAIGAYKKTFKLTCAAVPYCMPGPKTKTKCEYTGDYEKDVEVEEEPYKNDYKQDDDSSYPSGPSYQPPADTYKEPEYPSDDKYPEDKPYVSPSYPQGPSSYPPAPAPYVKPVAPAKPKPSYPKSPAPAPPPAAPYVKQTYPKAPPKNAYKDPPY